MDAIKISKVSKLLRSFSFTHLLYRLKECGVEGKGILCPEFCISRRTISSTSMMLGQRRNCGCVNELIYLDGLKCYCPIQVPYPMISLVTRLPMTLEGSYPLIIHLRNFRSLTMSFERDSESLDVFESIRGLTVTCE